MQGEAILGLEAAAAGLLSPGDKVLNLVSGVFGKWFEDFIHKYGGETIELAVPYNDAIDPEDVRQALHANPGVKFLSVVHSETPSGTHNPVQEIGAVAHEFGVLTMVDTVSGLGAELLSPEEWGMDIAIAGPQKCLGGTPGLSLMSISPAAWEALEARKPEPLRASFLSILDWKSAWLEGKRFPYTPSVSEMYSLESVLDQTLAVGMERFVDRQQTIARACREGVKALGLELWPAREEIAAACVTAVRVPEGIDDAELRGTMRHRYGVMISPGYGELLRPALPARAHGTGPGAPDHSRRAARGAGAVAWPTSAFRCSSAPASARPWPRSTDGTMRVTGDGVSEGHRWLRRNGST